MVLWALKAIKLWALPVTIKLTSSWRKSNWNSRMTTWKKAAISHLRLKIKITTRARPHISIWTWLIWFRIQVDRVLVMEATVVPSATECSSSVKSRETRASAATPTSSLKRLETRTAAHSSLTVKKLPEVKTKVAMVQTIVRHKMWAPLTARCPLERMKKVKWRS